MGGKGGLLSNPPRLHGVEQGQTQRSDQIAQAVMFEGEERWSRNCGSGIGLSNYKNIFRDGALVGNWQEDLYGNELPDRTQQGQEAEMYTSTTMADYERPPMDELQRGASSVESVPYEMLFGHGKMLHGETRASNAEASMSEIHYTKPNWEKRAAHTMGWVGEKDNDLTMPAIAHSRQHLLEAKRAAWEDEVTRDVHGTSVSREQFKNPSDQPLQYFKSEPRKPRANYLGRTIGGVHHQMGLRK